MNIINWCVSWKYNYVGYTVAYVFWYMYVLIHTIIVLIPTVNYVFQCQVLIKPSNEPLWTLWGNVIICD